MRKIILASVAVLIVGGAATGIMIARAQPAPAQPGMDSPGFRPHWMGSMDRGQGWRRGPGTRGMRAFALVYQEEDRKLTPPDVQKIAEAFLLWRGNHTWKVVEVAPAADGSIGFALATPEGSVIARFSIDPHNARVTRTG